MTSVPTCARSFNQLFNSLGQSPCYVAAALGGVCHNGSYSVPGLPSGNMYLGPSQSNPPTPCTCSSVFYSTLSACAACQEGSFLTFSQYMFNCTSIYSGFPLQVPSWTVVPDYAYVLLNATSTFNVPSGAGNGPVLGPSGLPIATTTFSVITLSKGPASTASPKSTVTSGVMPISTGPANTTSSKSKVGAIAGGVVAGVVGVILVAILVYLFFIRRLRSGDEASFSLVRLNSEGEPTMSHASPRPSSPDLSVMPFTTPSNDANAFARRLANPGTQTLAMMKKEQTLALQNHLPHSEPIAQSDSSLRRDSVAEVASLPPAYSAV